MESQDQQNVINNNLNNEIKKEEEKKEDFKVTKKIIAGRELIAVEGGIYMQKLTEKDLKELEGGQTVLKKENHVYLKILLKCVTLIGDVYWKIMER